MRQLAAAIGMTRALMSPERKIIEDCPPDDAPRKPRFAPWAPRTRRREALVTRR